MSPVEAARSCRDLYLSLPPSYHPQLSGLLPTFTVLAGFALLSPSGDVKPISIATGCKVLPASRLPLCGDVVHDSHAEILTRRGAVYWMLHEVGRERTDWLERRESGKWRLKDGTRVVMYISCLPCGDASMAWLASVQNPDMAALKDGNPSPTDILLTRGRNGYSATGILRTKPGGRHILKADTVGYDKIASWTICGIQGSLLSSIMEPVYVSDLVIGGVPHEVRAAAMNDCVRAFDERLRSVEELPGNFRRIVPQIHFTDIQFPQSKDTVQRGPATSEPVASNEALSWIADCSSPEMLVNGIKKGAALKRPSDDVPLRASSRSRLCKLSIFALYVQIWQAVRGIDLQADMTYHEAKNTAGCSDYQSAKAHLRGPGCPFSVWIVSGQRWESFDKDGHVASKAEPARRIE